MDMNFDRGTTKLVADGDGQPLLIESGGFVLLGRFDTQDQARAAKKAVRALGDGFQEVDYDILAAPV